MPKMNGIEATKSIISQFPNVKILALSMYADKRFIEEMYKAGASGYVLKNKVFSDLHPALNKLND